MANATSSASFATKRTGVPPSRALMVIPQPPRRSAWRAVAAAMGGVFALPFLLPALAVRMLLVPARAAGRVALGGGRGLGCAAWLAVRGAALLALGVARLAGRGFLGLCAAGVAAGRGLAAGAQWTARSTARLAGVMTILAAYVAFGVVAFLANVTRALGVALLAAVSAAAYGLYHLVRGLGLALLGLVRGLVATGTAVVRMLAGFARGVLVGLAATMRFLVPARPGAAVAVAAGAYVLLAGAERIVPFGGHVLATTPAAIAVLALVAFVVAALYGFASRTAALGLLALLCIAGVHVAAAGAAQGAWAGAAAWAVVALFAGHAAFRFGRAFAYPAAARSPSITRAHRDAGLGVVAVVLGELAVCGVWLVHLPAAERTVQLVIDLGSIELAAVAFGGWLAVSAVRGRHLRAVQVVLVAAATVVLVLGIAASLEALGQRRGVTSISLALGGLLLIVATALCLVVRARIADGSYVPASNAPGATA